MIGHKMFLFKSTIVKAFLFIIICSPAWALELVSGPSEVYTSNDSFTIFSSVRSDRSDCSKFVIDVEIRDVNSEKSLVSMQSFFDLKGIDFVYLTKGFFTLKKYEPTELFSAPSGDVFVPFGEVFAGFWTAHYQDSDTHLDLSSAYIPKRFLGDMFEYIISC